MTSDELVKYPGFVDLQVNGYLGVDFSDPSLTEDQLTTACDALLNQGTVAFLPTVITSEVATYEHNLPIIAELVTHVAYRGRLLGIHLEGPFISKKPGAVGAHNPDFVRKPDIEFLNHLLDLACGTVKLLTVAAEVPGIESIIEFALDKEITVSIGHSLFDTQTLHTANICGATALTHLGNGLPNVLPRHPNPLWAGLADDGYTAMLITDGHHLPEEVIRVAVRAKGVKNLVVVSDAAPVAGLPPGHYTFSGNDAVLEPTGKFHNPEKQCLVGSSATMIQCMNVLATLEELTPEELLDVGFYNPLKLINCSDKEISYGPMVVYDTHTHQFTLTPSEKRV